METSISNEEEGWRSDLLYEKLFYNIQLEKQKDMAKEKFI